MRIPKSPFLYFRFVEEPGAGEIVMSTGKRSVAARQHMVDVVRRVKLRGIEIVPKIRCYDPKKMPPKGASAMMSYDGNLRVTWTDLPEDRLRDLCNYAQRLLRAI